MEPWMWAAALYPIFYLVVFRLPIWLVKTYFPEGKIKHALLKGEPGYD